MGQARTLSDREFVKLIERVGQGRHGQRNQLMLYMTHYAGFRVGELSALKVSDVIDDEGNVREQVILEAHQTKGNRGRCVFLPAKLRQLIERSIKAKDKTEWLFTSQKGDRFTPNTLQATITRLYLQTGLNGCSSHSGRRSFLTKLASQGVSVRVLQELAGHKHIGTTQRYIDVNDEMKRSALLLV
jgi:integrase/recombinase XerD